MTLGIAKMVVEENLIKDKYNALILYNAIFNLLDTLKQK